jgi:predicted DNA-binding transcriptional regulator YafY
VAVLVGRDRQRKRRVRDHLQDAANLAGVLSIEHDNEQGHFESREVGPILLVTPPYVVGG